jgi:PIN domain nuclease of toxin-antitoxin system
LGAEALTFLLDTHVWVWAVEAPENLGRRTKTLLQKSTNERLVSAISVLEIARLCANQSIIFSTSPRTWVEASARDLLLRHVAVEYPVSIEAYALPEPFHRDPVDRILVATARMHQAILLTCDERILAYPNVRAEDCKT